MAAAARPPRPARPRRGRRCRHREAFSGTRSQPPRPPRCGRAVPQRSSLSRPSRICTLIGHGRRRRIVADHHHHRRAVLRASSAVTRTAGAGGVKPAAGLVGKQQRRLVGDGGAHRHPRCSPPDSSAGGGSDAGQPHLPSNSSRARRCATGAVQASDWATCGRAAQVGGERPPIVLIDDPQQPRAKSVARRGCPTPRDRARPPPPRRAPGAARMRAGAFSGRSARLPPFARSIRRVARRSGAGGDDAGSQTVHGGGHGGSARRRGDRCQRPRGHRATPRSRHHESAQGQRQPRLGRAPAAAVARWHRPRASPAQSSRRPAPTEQDAADHLATVSATARSRSCAEASPVPHPAPRVAVAARRAGWRRSQAPGRPLQQRHAAADTASAWRRGRGSTRAPSAAARLRTSGRRRAASRAGLPPLLRHPRPSPHLSRIAYPASRSGRFQRLLVATRRRRGVGNARRR